MPKVVSYSDVESGRVERKVPGGTNWRTDFMLPPLGVDDTPMAFLSESTGGRVIRTHYHALDQFHVIVKGDCTLGAHHLPKYAVHFVRAYTPYGEMTAGAQGLGFLSMYPRRDSGAHYLPERTEELKAVGPRSPWQASDVPRFTDGALTGLQPLPRIQNAEGLAAYVLTVAPGMRARAPSADSTDGQYLLITHGSVTHEGQEKGPLTLIFVRPGEPCLEIEAGDEGIQALVLHFPRSTSGSRQFQRDTRPQSAAEEFKVWQCELCGLVYDEEAGLPEEGIPAGTRWADVPDNWKCPDCAATKADFRVIEIT